MFLGLLITAGASVGFTMLVLYSDTFNAVAGSKAFYYGIIIGELALVISVRASINKISVGLARFLYIFYAVLNGITISYILAVYAGDFQAVTKAFVMASIFFVTLAVYGAFTKTI